MGLVRSVSSWAWWAILFLVMPPLTAICPKDDAVGGSVHDGVITINESFHRKNPPRRKTHIMYSLEGYEPESLDFVFEPSQETNPINSDSLSGEQSETTANSAYRGNCF